MDIGFLKAEHGDCIFISYRDNNILIDTGTRNTYYKQNGNKKIDGVLKKKIKKLEKIDLLVLTHVDNDHIGGAMKWLKMKPNEFKEKIGKVWFNSGQLIYEHLKFDGLIWSDNKYKMKLKDFNYQYNRFYKNSLKMIFPESKKTSIIDGITFEKKIKEYKLWDRELILAGQEYNKFDANFKILSPSKITLKALLRVWTTKKPDYLTDGSKYKTVKERQKDDYATKLRDLNINNFKENKQAHNGSSIAFILEIEAKKMLFLADSFPSIVCESLYQLGYSSNKKLKVEFVKISHHGSQGNTSLELLEMIETNKYIFSTKGNKHGHPNKTTFARILKNNLNAEFYFNYPKLEKEVFLEDDDFKDYPNMKIYSTEELRI